MKESTVQNVDVAQKYLKIGYIAKHTGLSRRRIKKYCRSVNIPGVFLHGKKEKLRFTQESLDIFLQYVALERVWQQEQMQVEMESLTDALSILERRIQLAEERTEELINFIAPLPPTQISKPRHPRDLNRAEVDIDVLVALAAGMFVFLGAALELWGALSIEHLSTIGQVLIASLYLFSTAVLGVLVLWAWRRVGKRHNDSKDDYKDAISNS